MKRIILLLLTAICLSAFLRAQTGAIDEMFKKYSGRDGFTVVTISGKMFSMIANLDRDNESADNIINNLNSIQILTVEDSLLNQDINFYTELSKKLNLNVYEEMMGVKEGRDMTKFLIRSNEDKITELLIITGGPGGNSLISIRGNLSMKNISDLSKSMDIKQLEEFEKMNKKKPK